MNSTSAHPDFSPGPSPSTPATLKSFHLHTQLDAFTHCPLSRKFPLNSLVIHELFRYRPTHSDFSPGPSPSPPATLKSVHLPSQLDAFTHCPLTTKFPLNSLVIHRLFRYRPTHSDFSPIPPHT